MEKAVAYARYSSDAQKEESIDEQLREIYQFAKFNDFEIIRNYTDYSLSGKFDIRPQFEQMLKDSASGEFHAVIVFDLSRFSRGGELGIADSVVLSKNDVKLVSVTEKFTEDLGGKLYKMLKFLTAEEYITNLSLNVKRGQTDNALKAKWNGGTPPFGYDVDKDTLQLKINDLEAPGVRLIFEQYAKGSSLRQICQMLKEQGFVTKKYGKDFSITSLHDILRNEKYIGKYIFRKTQRIKKPGVNKKVLQPVSNNIIIENGVPAIIDKALWETCQARVLLGKKSNNTKSKLDWNLTGKIKCECGGSYTGNGYADHFIAGRKVRTYYYACTNRKKGNGCRRISKNALEQTILKIIINEVYGLRKLRTNARALVEAQKEFDKDSFARKKVLEKRANVLQRKIDNLLEYCFELNMPGEKYRELNDKYQFELIQVKSELESLSSNIILNYEDMVDALMSLREKIIKNDLTHKQIFDMHVKSVLVKKDTTEVVIDFLPQILGDNNYLWCDFNGADERNRTPTLSN